MEIVLVVDVDGPYNTSVLRGQQYENQLADHQKCNSGEINISYQRIRKKERTGKVMGVHTVRR